MKTTIPLFIFILLFLSIHSYCQEKKLLVGIKAGLNYSTVSTESKYSEPGYKSGLCSGLNAGYKVHKSILLLLEADYDQKGYKEGIEFTDNAGNPLEDVSVKYVFNYITVPVSINYSTGGKNTFEAGAGFYNSFLSSAKLKIKGILVEGHPVEDINIKEGCKTYEPGIFVRAAETISLSSKLGLLIEGRYAPGLGNINNNGELNITNSGFFLGTGMRYYFLSKSE